MDPSPFQPSPRRRISEPTSAELEADLVADIARHGKPYVPRAKTIKSVVKNWSISRNVSAEQTSLMTEQQWNAIIGDLLANYTRPGHIKRGVLHISVDSPLVMQELAIRKGEILKKLQDSLPDHGIKSLKFRID